jgi:hypothetical protein
MNRTLAALLVSASLVCVAPFASAEKAAPDATIELSGKTVAVGVGYTEAKGTLHYQGKSYPVVLKGLSAGQIGASTITAAGEVYHLASVKDLDGNYTSVSAGVALAGGGTGTAMQNQKGVVINLRGTTEGVDLRLSVDGVSVKVAQ